MDGPFQLLFYREDETVEARKTKDGWEMKWFRFQWDSTAGVGRWSGRGKGVSLLLIFFISHEMPITQTRHATSHILLRQLSYMHCHNWVKKLADFDVDYKTREKKREIKQTTRKKAVLKSMLGLEALLTIKEFVAARFLFRKLRRNKFRRGNPHVLCVLIPS